MLFAFAFVTFWGGCFFGMCRIVDALVPPPARPRTVRRLQRLAWAGASAWALIALGAWHVMQATV